MSQKEVARELGVSVATISTIERRALRKLRRQSKALRELRGLLALKHDGLWPRPRLALDANLQTCSWK